MTDNPRAARLMGAGGEEQRRSPRHSVYAGATLSAGETTHLAWIKDISNAGVSLFTKHPPEIGENVSVVVDSNHLPADTPREFEGTVIRVQNSGSGAVGVAISLGSEL